jgi:hypothetical protein
VTKLTAVVEEILDDAGLTCQYPDAQPTRRCSYGISAAVTR